MEVYDVILTELKITVSILVERKKIKNCRLKVYPDKTVKLSVPEGTPQQWIKNFLKNKSKWLSQKIQFYEQAKGNAKLDKIYSGISICYLGEDLTVNVSQSSKARVYLEDRKIYIWGPDINDQNKLFSQYDKWWRKESLKLLNSKVDKFYPIVEKHNVNKPEIQLRKMKTLWGSCSLHRGIITFNQYLTMAPLVCVEYVVLHELVHFIHPNHSKQFYDFLSQYMPDWQARKKALSLFLL